MSFATDRPRAGYCVCALAVLALAVAPSAQEPSAALGPFEVVLDTYVRDGYVYYRALKSDRRRLDEYVNSLASANVDKAPSNAQIAFWLNAYNALVLRTVIDHYPAPRRSTDYPQGSIRQTPGAFERLTHRVGGRTLTLDQIEQTVLSKYSDPRLHFAIGRGSVGGGRLRSEMFSEALLEKQLVEVAEECVTRAECIQIDNSMNTLNASSIFLVEREGVRGGVCRQGRSALCHAGARSSARSSRSCVPSSFKPSAIFWKRTPSSSPTGPSTGRSTTSLDGETAEIAGLQNCRIAGRI